MYVPDGSRESLEDKVKTEKGMGGHTRKGNQKHRHKKDPDVNER